PEAEGGGRNDDDAPGLAGDDGDRGGHAGTQQQPCIVHVEAGIVGDHALGGDGGEGDVADGGVELAVGEGVDGEARLLPRLDGADVCLVDGGLQLHALQFGGDDEEHRRLHGGGDRLAGVDGAGQDHAVDGRDDAA